MNTLKGLLLCCALYTLQTPPAQASSLDRLQRNTALVIAQNADWPQFTARSIVAEEAAIHPLGVQTLSIEKREQKKSSTAVQAQATLNVYQFNYELAQSRLLLVDTTSEAVLSSHKIASVHLPLNQTEVDFAIELVNTQKALLDTFRNEQIQSGRTPFTELDQLDVKASIYEPLDTSSACATQRCALLSLFDDSNTVFSTEPVVNLQTLSVTLLSDR